MESPELLGCGPDRIHLGVRSGVAIGANETVPFRDKRAFGINNDGTNRGPADLSGMSGGSDGQAHVPFVSPDSAGGEIRCDDGSGHYQAVFLAPDHGAIPPDPSLPLGPAGERGLGLPHGAGEGYRRLGLPSVRFRQRNLGAQRRSLGSLTSHAELSIESGHAVGQARQTVAGGHHCGASGAVVTDLNEQ